MKYLKTWRWLLGTLSHSKPGSGGTFCFGPMKTQSMPALSSTGYDVSFTFSLYASPSVQLGISTQLPSTSNFQPWYTQRRPHSSLRPKNNGALRCGQKASTMAALPLVSLKAMRSSPRSLSRTGSQSGPGNSSDNNAGIQKRRNNSPIGVPGPTCVSNWLSLDDSIQPQS